jgi:uncharacterized membrane protein
MNEIESLEIKLANFLRRGVLTAGTLLLIGWIWKTKWQANPFSNFDSYDQISFLEIIRHHFYFSDWGALVCYLGLLILISLPFIRVFLTTVLFIKQKEYLLAGIAVLVLFGLALSIFLGIEL